MKAMTLDELPIDIAFHILTFLDPIDIILLRLTCRVFYSLTCERSVWMNAFLNFSKINQVHSNTFDPPRMSTTQLEDAITTPSRFIRKLLPSGNGNTHPMVSPIFMRVISLGSPTTLRVTFVPGGRFLLAETASRTTDRVFTLLDLDPPNGEYRVHSRWECPGLNWESVILPSNNDQKFRFVISPRKYLAEDLSLFYVVVEISQSAEGDEIINVQLKRHTLHSSTMTHEPGRRLRSYQVIEEIFIFDYKDDNENQHIVAWDFVIDKAVVWEIFPDHLQSPLTIHNGYIAMVVGTSLRGWKIPDFSRVNQGTTLRLQNHHVAFNIECIPPDARLHCRGSVKWHGHGGLYGAQIFDMIDTSPYLFGYGEPRNHKLLVWTFVDPPAQLERGALVDSQIHGGNNSEPYPSMSYLATSGVPTILGDESYERRRIQALNFGSPFTICENHIIRLLQNQDGYVFAHTTPLQYGATVEGDGNTENKPPRPPRGFVVRVVVDRPNDHVHGRITKPSFDHISGRLACVPQEDGSIFVVDYVSRRSSPT